MWERDFDSDHLWSGYRNFVRPESQPCSPFQRRSCAHAHWVDKLQAELDYSTNMDQTLQGDSGGPLSVRDPLTNQHELIGVVSWGRGGGKKETKVRKSIVIHFFEQRYVFSSVQSSQKLQRLEAGSIRKSNKMGVEQFVTAPPQGHHHLLQHHPQVKIMLISKSMQLITLYIVHWDWEFFAEYFCVTQI